ncbi:MAG: DUF2785 domain-containing protein [Ectobacillus sp.]
MEQELKTELQHIRDNGYAVPDDADAYPYAQWMLDAVGSPDFERQDELIYDTLAHWIDRGEFRAKELRGLLLQVLSPGYLFWGIGEKGTDSVLKRAFSVRIVALMLAAHEREPFLSYEQLMSVAEEVIQYVYEEQDARGLAYGANALDALVRVLEDVGFAQAALIAIRRKIGQADFECERLVMTLWDKELLTEAQWRSWFSVFAESGKPFLRRLYSSVRQTHPACAALVLETLEQLGEFE